MFFVFRPEISQDHEPGGRVTRLGAASAQGRMKAMRGVQMAAKGVGEAFTGGRDLHQMLHALHSTTISVEAYFSQPSFERVLPDNLKQWAASLCGEAKEAYKRLKSRVEQMEKDGVRGAAESSLHALSSAAGAITGIAMLDVGRHIADELVQTTAALNDVLARATRLVTLANCAMLEKLAEEKGLTMPTAMEVNPLLTKLEIDNIRARIWVHQIEDGSVVAGDKVSVTWDTIGQVPLVNVRLKNSMGVETSRGKTVQRLTIEAGTHKCAPSPVERSHGNMPSHAHSCMRAHMPSRVPINRRPLPPLLPHSHRLTVPFIVAGEPNKGHVNDVLPLDFMPGKYTVAVSDPSNNIRGMTFVSVSCRGTPSLPPHRPSPPLYPPLPITLPIFFSSSATRSSGKTARGPQASQTSASTLSDRSPSCACARAHAQVLKAISVAEVIEPASGMGRSLAWRVPTWNRGTSHKISWRMNRGKVRVRVCKMERDRAQRAPERTGGRALAARGCVQQEQTLLRTA